MADGFSMTYSGPDLSRRGARKAFRAGLSEALKNHRTKFLPLHFSKTAESRYPQEYKGAQNTRSHSHRVAYLREKFRKMTPAERRAYREDLAKKGPKKKGSSQDPYGQIPLLDSGRMGRAAVLTGSPNFRGVANLSEFTLRISGLPFYATINQPGGINKEAAMTAVAPDEQTAFAAVLDTEVQAWLDSRTST